ncbi:hypothetical protein ODJ79_05825 [Actinoplanes sp. KI2]|uniref:hypothetical protein n=1 Tax=Actinoplanes sp. KI2 TaxID=2983315 RepID=UPI0021D57921|nr:hypothetical protein [Actinoplanes sp. KI2]MCU7723222.1 hypothetical protein [Actinoplanes sp. KI2]
MSQQPYPYPAPVPPPPPSGRWQPERVDQVPGTEFALVQLRVEPLTSGLAIGSLLAGIAAILVSMLVLCFGLLGAQDGWGAVVGGAFTLLSVIGGVGAIVVGLVARRQIRGSGGSGQVRFTGRGIAAAGISCGAVGAGIALAALALSLMLQLSSSGT